MKKIKIEYFGGKKWGHSLFKKPINPTERGIIINVTPRYLFIFIQKKIIKVLKWISDIKVIQKKIKLKCL